jgi:hypothetical protein
MGKLRTLSLTVREAREARERKTSLGKKFPLGTRNLPLGTNYYPSRKDPVETLSAIVSGLGKPGHSSTAGSLDTPF